MLLTTYKLVKPKINPSGVWEDGLYEVKGKVTIPDNFFRSEAIVEDFEAKGLKETCKRVTIGNNSWIIVANDDDLPR